MFCIPEESGAPCFDRLGGASGSSADRGCHIAQSVEVSPDVSARRESKRITGIRAVKQTEIYTRALLLASESDELERARPLSPDPYDRTVSKRSWEALMQRWRNALCVFAARDTGPWNCDVSGEAITDCVAPQCSPRDICLVHALRAHGFPVQVNRDGPFWVLRDGNAFLAPFAHHIIPVGKHALSPGRYVLASLHHFNAVVDAERRPWVVCEASSGNGLRRSIKVLHSDAMMFRI